MTTKRVIILGVFIGLTILGLYVGKLFLMGHYRQKADSALFFTGDYKTAIHYYDKLLWWYPDNGGLYYKRGEAYNYTGQYESAIADYRKSLQIEPDSLEVVLSVALTAKNLGDLKTEEQMLLSLLKISKARHDKLKFWAANYHLGQLEFKRGNYRTALNYYNEAHNTDTTMVNLYHRANAYYALGYLDSAHNDFKKSIRFVKADYVREYPNSELAKCDTCGFPFGSPDYELLTESKHEALIPLVKRLKVDSNLVEVIVNSRY